MELSWAAGWVRIGGMPTVPRRPAVQREREQLEARRLQAAELFAAGVHQAEVARQLEVSAQAVSVWHGRWREGGVEALRSRGPSGPAPRLSDAQLATVEQALLEVPRPTGSSGAMDSGPRGGGRAPHWGPASSRPRLGAAPSSAGLDGPAAQAPRRRTRPGRHRPVGQRPLAADSANAQRRRACLAFFDESALSLTPMCAGPGRHAASHRH